MTEGLHWDPKFVELTIDTGPPWMVLKGQKGQDYGVSRSGSSSSRRARFEPTVGVTPMPLASKT